MPTTVWAYAPLEALAGETGLVSIEDDALAAKLLKSGEVQDPRVGGVFLKHIEAGKGGYKTREMKAETGASKSGVGEGDKDDPPKDDKKKPAKGK